MAADLALAVAAIDADREPDWARAEAFVGALSEEELLDYLDSPAELSFFELGSGLDRVRRELLDDLARFRAAFEEGDPRLLRLSLGGTLLLIAGEGESSAVFHTMGRLRWSGALQAAGFEEPEDLDRGEARGRPGG